MTKICFSGGAVGADLAWGDAARARGYRVVHFSFEGHKTRSVEPERVILTQKQLRSANQHCSIAGRDLGRGWPPKFDYTRKLLQRNWFQVKTTLAVYAVGYMDQGGAIVGGTAWAVKMYLNARVPHAQRAFFFDQNTGKWLSWSGGWTPIERPPAPPHTFTGIGTRKLLPIGAEAIRGVFC